VTVEEAIAERLLEISAVTALVDSRIWVVENPQSPTHPSIRVAPITDMRGHHLRGPHGVQTASVQIDMYVSLDNDVDPYAQITELGSAVCGDGLGTQASGLDGWIGRIGSPGFVVRECLQTMRYSPRVDADELRTLTLTQEFYVRYEA
jgi:hypothetical protein